MPQIVNIAIISTHAPAGGATIIAECEEQGIQFLLTPLREGRLVLQRLGGSHGKNFYSRPCGRGDTIGQQREILCCYFYSRPCGRGDPRKRGGAGARLYFYSRPCGRGDLCQTGRSLCDTHFYSRPCGRGDLRRVNKCEALADFYSRPCGRGDDAGRAQEPMRFSFLLTPLREGRQQFSTSPS